MLLSRKDSFDHGFFSAAKILKPTANAPVGIQVKHTARLAPTPLGATFDTIKELIDLKKWQARPIKSVGPQAWIIGLSEKGDENWISWNERMLLLTSEEEFRKVL